VAFGNKILNDESLRKCFYIVLKVGNLLNEPPSGDTKSNKRIRGYYGFDLDTMAKLDQVKDDKGMPLSRFVYELIKAEGLLSIIDKFPELDAKQGAALQWPSFGEMRKDYESIQAGFLNITTLLDPEQAALSAEATKKLQAFKTKNDLSKWDALFEQLRDVIAKLKVYLAKKDLNCVAAISTRGGALFEFYQMLVKNQQLDEQEKLRQEDMKKAYRGSPGKSGGGAAQLST
jgi:hypothetical protein